MALQYSILETDNKTLTQSWFGHLLWFTATVYDCNDNYEEDNTQYDANNDCYPVRLQVNTVY